MAKTSEIFADTRNATRCRGCGAPIVFAQVVKSGRSMPFEFPLVALTTRLDDGQRLIEAVDLGASHFARCSAADRFRKART